MKKRQRALFGLALAITLVLGSQGARVAARAALPADSSTLTIVMAHDVVGLDPQAVEDNSAGFVMSTIFDNLLEYKPGTTDVGPGLATSWTVSRDGKTYTFTLRKGVRFQDGAPFNAQALVQDLDRLLNPHNKNYVLNEPAVASYITFTYSLVKTYKALDANTVRITLSAPFAPFPSSLAMVWSGVMSPAAVRKYGALGVLQHPVGTGPYRFVEWVKNDHITVEANPYYWGPQPKVKRLIFQVVPEGSVRVLKLKRGEAQIDADVTTQDYQLALHDPTINILKQPGLTINGIGMTVDVKPLNDVRVRQALNYAVDKQALAKFLYKGLGIPMNSLIPPSEWSYDASLQGYPYNPARAKQLLRAAGYPHGFTIGLLAYSNPRGYNAAGGGLAVAVQQYLKAVGVAANITLMDFGAFLTKIRSGSYHGMFMTGWSGDNGDPDNFLYELFSTPNIPVGDTVHLRDAKLDAILLQAREATSQETRVRLYRQAQKIIDDDAPWIMGTYTTQVRFTTSNVHGFLLNPAQMFFGMQNVSLQ